MKKLTVILGSFLFIAGTSYFLYRVHNPAPVKPRKTWSYFQKDHTKIVKIEKEEKPVDRAPSSIRPPQEQKQSGRKSVLPKRGGRLLLGSNAALYQDRKKPLNMVNYYNHDWDRLLSHKLLRQLSDGTKASIKREVSLIQINGQTGRFLEQVIINLEKQNGKRSSFRALVDSQTGAVIRTWDQTIHEDRREDIPSYESSGAIF